MEKLIDNTAITVSKTNEVGACLASSHECPGRRATTVPVIENEPL